MTQEEKIDKIYHDNIWIKTKLLAMPCTRHDLKLENLESFKNKFFGFFFATNLFTGIITFILSRIWH